MKRSALPCTSYRGSLLDARNPFHSIYSGKRASCISCIKMPNIKHAGAEKALMFPKAL